MWAHTFNRHVSLLFITALLTACGGGSDEPAPSSAATDCTTESCGTVLINLMDADGDFLSYTVDVVSLSLKKANGAVVETLPVQPRVDFAELVDLKELLTAATVPNGSYVSGTIRLDYSNADISVDVGGVPVKATPVDANGEPLTTLDLDIELSNRRQVVVAPGRPALLELDFDLEASNTVDLNSEPLQVAVQPFVVATVNVADSREARLRGPLVEVATTEDFYQVDLRPFNHPNAQLGIVKVNVTDETIYDIDGVSFTGDAGLAQLAALDLGAPSVAFGAFETATREFTAERVNAGSSVAGAEFDAVEGHVIARSGNALTLRGTTLYRREGSVNFVRGDVALSISDTTEVQQAGQPDTALDIAAISVGQRVLVFGTVNDNGTDIDFDATEGRVRLQMTRLVGSVQDSASDVLTLNLQSIGPHRASIFNFAGTGLSSAEDATAENYELATTGLNTVSFTSGVPARAFGFVTTFGVAPPDFNARTLVSLNDAHARLAIGWTTNGTSTPFLSSDAESIVLDNSNTEIGTRHYISTGPAISNILELEVAPRIIPEEVDEGVFAIGEPRRVQLFDSFAEFSAELNERLAGGQELIALHANGRFDSGTSEFSARRLLATLTRADN
jgi:hypothetical protein